MLLSQGSDASGSRGRRRRCCVPRELGSRQTVIFHSPEIHSCRGKIILWEGLVCSITGSPNCQSCKICRFFIPEHHTAIVKKSSALNHGTINEYNNLRIWNVKFLFRGQICKMLTTKNSIHPISTSYPRLGCGGSSVSREAETSLSPAT